MRWLHVTENFFIWKKLQLVLNVAACLLRGQAGMNAASQISSEERFKSVPSSWSPRPTMMCQVEPAAKSICSFQSRTSANKHTGVNPSLCFRSLKKERQKSQHQQYSNFKKNLRSRWFAALPHDFLMLGFPTTQMLLWVIKNFKATVMPAKNRKPRFFGRRATGVDTLSQLVREVASLATFRAIEDPSLHSSSNTSRIQIRKDEKSLKKREKQNKIFQPSD